MFGLLRQAVLVELLKMVGLLFLNSEGYVPPALTVFVWLPLLAVGIIATRALKPLSWAVGKAQWALKDGNEHPLKAVGYLGGVLVFTAVAGWKAFL